jgi:hypothetical protein
MAQAPNAPPIAKLFGLRGKLSLPRSTLEPLFASLGHNVQGLYSLDKQPADPDYGPWFVLADVCRAFDIKNPSDVAAKQLDDDEKKIIRTHSWTTGSGIGSEGFEQRRPMLHITESGILRLAIKSRKGPAKRFIDLWNDSKLSIAEVRPRSLTDTPVDHGLSIPDHNLEDRKVERPALRPIGDVPAHELQDYRASLKAYLEQLPEWTEFDTIDQRTMLDMVGGMKSDGSPYHNKMRREALRLLKGAA